MSHDHDHAINVGDASRKVENKLFGYQTVEVAP